MKRLFLVFLAVATLLCVSACAGDGDSSLQSQSTSSNGTIELPEDKF